MKKKIGLLIPNLLHGGAEKVLAQISDILSHQYDVYMILFDGKSISYNFSGQLINLNCRAKRSILNKAVNSILRVFRLNKIKKDLQLDLVISFLRSANIVNYFSNNQGKKLISCRGYSDFLKSNKLYARMLKKVDGIIFPSLSMSQEFIENYNADSKTIITLYNPIDIDKIELLKNEDVEDKFIEFITSHKTICNMGSFKKDKGQWHLIKTFCILKEKAPEAGLVFIGDGGELEKEIIKMASSTPYKDDIIFLGYQKNPYKYLAKCDVFVMPSLHEGFPNALVEAMACGLPVIATDCKSGPREILTNKYDKSDIIFDEHATDFGILLPVFNGEVDFVIESVDNKHRMLSNAIVRVLQDSSLNNRLSENGRIRVIDFNLFSFRNRIIGVINNLI